jgi:hypothetical protein
MVTNIKNSFYIALLLTLCMLTACSGIKTYSSNMGKNLHVTTKTDSSVDAAIDVYRVETDCSIKYSGTIKLNNSNVDIGIPAGRSSYLVFSFSSSGFFSGSSTTTYSTLLRPRSDQNKYDIDVSYIENIYNVVIHEGKRGSSKSREIEARNLSTCKPL